MGLGVLAHLSASRSSNSLRAKHSLLLLPDLQQSSRASGVLHQIQVSLQSHRRQQHSHDASLPRNQHLLAGSSTTHDERNKSCDYWKRHMHGAWQQRKQQQQQCQASEEELTLGLRWCLIHRSVS